jgi:peptidylprolyl isomerase
VLGLGLITGLAACTGEGEPAPSASSTDVVAEPPDDSASADPSLEASAEPSAEPSEDPDATPAPETVDASSTLDAITVEGGPGEQPVITVPAPWAIDQSRNKVLSYGSGATVPSGGFIKVMYHGVNGRTGLAFDSSFDSEFGHAGPSVFSLNQVVPGFSKGLAGQRVGSRVLLAMPGSDAYDSSETKPAGIETGDTLIFVVDILESSVSGPEGEPVSPARGLPVLGGDADKPTLSLPSGATFPTKLVLQPLTEGSGDVAVAADSQIQVNFTEYAWSPNGDFRFIRQTYGYAPVTGLLSTTIPGWQQGLVGVTQGSRVLLVVPSADAYPNGDAKIGVRAGDASVFLIDVLFA